MSTAIKLNVTMIAILCCVTAISQFLRNSVGVIAPDLARELTLSPTQIGSLSSIFFFIFALVQIPVGIGIDRFGPRALILGSASLTVLGCLVFAWGQTPLNLMLARLLMGLGCSSFFMAPLVIYARWYPPERFSMLAGLQQGIGTLGTLLATAPLAYLVMLVGWRGSFISVALLTLMVSALVFWRISDTPPHTPPQSKEKESWAQSFAGVREVVATSGFAALMAIHLAGHTAFASVIGLWLSPYLRDVYGLDILARGQILLVGALAHVIGLLLWGNFAKFFKDYRQGTVLGASIAIACFIVLILYPHMPLWLFVVWISIYGLAISFQPLNIAHARTLFPARLTGRGITMLNMGTMGGVFIIQIASGWVIAQFSPTLINGVEVRDANAYLTAFALTGGGLALGTVLYRLLPVPAQSTKI